MKTTFLLFCLISLTTFGQTLNRQLYEKYFKPLYTYEPAMIRENKIESLETMLTETREDSVTFQALKERVYFRKDGRPTQMITYTDFHSDSLITDYTYDTLGNLVEYRQWKPDRYVTTKQRETNRLFFVYNANQLTRVIAYSMQNYNNYSSLSYCDSLSYSSNQKKVTIMHGNANNAFIEYDAKPKFVYPVNKKNITELIAIESDMLSKPADKESCWKTKCTYTNPGLEELQRLTGIECIPDNIVNSCRDVSGIEYEKPPLQKLDATVPPEIVLNRSGTIFIDTIEKRIYLKEDSFISIPTSMENRDIETHAIHQYDFSFRLLQTETLEESSRGQREHSKDSSQTVYAYFDFGLLERKQEIHHWSSAYRDLVKQNTESAIDWEVNPSIIFENRTIIKTW